MKDIYNRNPKDAGTYDFITKYEIENNYLHVYYSSGMRDVLELTKDNLIMIQDQMKNQILNAASIEKLSKRKINYDSFWTAYNVLFGGRSLYYIITSDNNNQKYFQACCLALFLLLSGLWINELVYNKERLDEIKKYKYFIENEDLINYDNIKRYFEENESNIPNLDDIQVLTINDINDITLIELKEMVELNTNNNDEEQIKLNLTNYRKLKGTI